MTDFDAVFETHVPDRLRSNLASAVSLLAVLGTLTWFALVIPVVHLVWSAAF